MPHIKTAKNNFKAKSGLKGFGLNKTMLNRKAKTTKLKLLINIKSKNDCSKNTSESFCPYLQA